MHLNLKYKLKLMPETNQIGKKKIQKTETSLDKKGKNQPGQSAPQHGTTEQSIF